MDHIEDLREPEDIVAIAVALAESDDKGRRDMHYWKGTGLDYSTEVVPENHLVPLQRDEHGNIVW